MKFKKQISKLLIAGILLNNLSIISHAGTLSPDTRYETFEGDSIKIEDIIEEDKIDVEIKGNTLINLFDTSKLPIERKSFTSIEDKYAFLGDVKSYVPLKANTTYTLYVKYDIASYTALSDDYNRATILPKFSYEDGTESYLTIKAIQSTGSYSNVVKITPNKNVSLFEIGLAVKNATVSGTLYEAMLLEGDYADKNIKYFEGIKSVGQNNDSDSIEIISQEGNPNLIKNSNWYVTATKDKEANPDNLNYGLIDGIDLQSLIGKELTLSFLVHTKGDWKNNYNKPIYGDENSRFGIHCSAYWSDSTGKNTGTVKTHPLAGILANYDIDLKRVSTTQVLTPPSGYDTLERFTFATQSYRLPADNNDETWVLGYPKLEFGNKATSWTPTVSEDTLEKHHNKVKINLSEPLRGLPNGTRDKIIKRNGQWVIERSLKEIILNETSDIIKGVDTEDSTLIRFDYRSSDIKVGYQNAICDSLPQNNVEDFYYVTTESINTHPDLNRNRIAIWIKKDKLQSEDINGIKQWLKNNPLKIVYALDTPFYEPLNIDSVLNLYEETTYISNNSNIPANMKVVVDRILNRAIDSSNEAVTLETIDSISTARAWINMLPESLRKDELQTKLNEIFNIDELNIDKKNVTSNTDVYIKPINTLMMSLSTNSITFDEFSGAEDLELNNALNIIVSSSLPYELNASLPTEIYNSDKTKSLPKNILNIKESTDSDYKTFHSLNDKVILKSINPSGNSIKHNIDLMLSGGTTYDKDVYKTTIKFEAIQK